MKKKERIPLSPKASALTHNFLAKHFHSRSYGAEYLLESFPRIYFQTLKEQIKGIFTAEEVKLMVEVFNIITTGLGKYAGQDLLNQCESGITIAELDKKWGVDRDCLLQKIKKLTAFEAACVEVFVHAYWYVKSEKERKSKGALDEYVMSII